MRSIAAAIAWADGTARRATAEADHATVDQVWSCVTDVILPAWAIPLASRILWQGAYSIPETIIPVLYERLAKLILDCFPQRSGVFIQVLEAAFDHQFGLYNEGFRQALAGVAEQFVSAELTVDTADALFNLIIRWRDYVAANVENRYELIPELLRIVPLLTRLDATEQAFQTYQLALRFSMGQAGTRRISCP